MSANTGGRPTLFPGKNYENRHTFALTDVGEREYNKARKRLATLTGWKVTSVLDSDVAEYVTRGHDAAVKDLGKRGLLVK